MFSFQFLNNKIHNYFKKNVNFKTRDFSLLIERTLAGVKALSNGHGSDHSAIYIISCKACKKQALSSSANLAVCTYIANAKKLKR